MTEIALAMAMGFFSVMVLTTISMGIGDGPSQKISLTTLLDSSPAESATPAEPMRNDDILVIFDGRQFLDQRLRPFDVTRIGAQPRIILAVDPSLPMKQTLAEKRRLNSPKTVVTILDSRWRRALRETTDAP